MASAAAPGPVPVDVTDLRIKFQGAWKSGADDPDRNNYHNGTYQTSSGNGDFVTFDWTGGDLTIVGSTKPNHGYYSITLDSAVKQYYDGHAATPVNKAVLWTSKGLVNGPHRVELRNENVYMQSSATQDRLVLDVDYMSYIPVAPVSPPAEVSKISSSTTTAATINSRATAISVTPSSVSMSSSSSSSSSVAVASSNVTRIASPGPATGPTTLSSTAVLISSTSSLPSTAQETLDFAIKLAITTGTPKLPPLPVEKSQGSVSALVARFQTAAAHNAATAEREASRRSSSSSSTSGVGDGPRVVSAGGWRKSGGETASGPTVLPTKGGVAEESEGMEVLRDGDGVGKDNEVRRTEIGETKVKPNGSESATLVDSSKKVETTPLKAATSKARLRTTPALAKPPSSPKATKIPPPISTASGPRKAVPSSPKLPTSPRQHLKSTSSVAADASTAASANHAAPKNAEASAMTQTTPLSPSTSKSGSAIISAGKSVPSSTSMSSLKQSPTTGSSGFSKAASTSATSKTTATRVSTSPSTSKSTPKAAAALNDTQSGTPNTSTPTAKPKSTTTIPKPRPTSTITPAPKPAPSNRPPSAFKPAKPLTPSVTGPASTRLSTSVHSQNPPITPLRPQVTGTPSKPTASSLAKTRGTPLASDSSTMSLGRPAGKRMSLGPVPTSSDRLVKRAGSESPAAGTKLEEGKAQRERVTGSSSMSRLMQGTAASRAKVIEGLPGTPSMTTPGKNKVANGSKDGVPKSGSARSLASETKSPTAKPGSRARLSSGGKAAARDSSVKTAQPEALNEPEEADKVEVPGSDGQAVEERVEPASGENVKDTAEAAESGEAGQSLSETHAETSRSPVEHAKSEPVGDSPIGRIGLAGAPLSMTNGTNGLEPVTDDIGQHPVVGPMPVESDPPHAVSAETEDFEVVDSGGEGDNGTAAAVAQDHVIYDDSMAEGDAAKEYSQGVKAEVVDGEEEKQDGEVKAGS